MKILVIPFGSAGDVHPMVGLALALKARGHDSYKLHKTASRPWGAYTVLQEGVGFKIKRIEVKPGAALSLQMHHHRSEHWVVVSGEALVTNGDKVYTLDGADKKAQDELDKLAGMNAKVTGTASGNTIQVASVAPSK